MRPLSLKLCAVGPYEKEIALDFSQLNDNDCLLIHGATGAGKTSIFDAICYALYGKGAMEGRDAKMMRNSAVPPEVDSYVEFQFSLDGEIYHIRRVPPYLRKAKRRGKKGELTEQKPEVRLELLTGEATLREWKDETEVSAKISSLLGFNYDQFRQVVLLPQGQFQKFLMSNTAGRKELMQVIFRTGLYQKVEEKLRQKSKDAAAAVEQNSRDQQKLLLSMQVASAAEFASLLAAQREKVTELENGIGTQKLQSEAARQAREAGSLLFAKFRERELAEAAADKARRQAEQDKDTALRLERAQRALQLQDLDAQLERKEAETEAQQQQLDRLTQQGTEIKQQKEQAEKDWQQEQQGEPELKQAGEELVKLKELSGVADELQELEKKAAGLSAQARQKEGEQQAVRQQLQSVRRRIEKDAEQHDRARQEGARAEAARSRAENLQAAIGRAEKLSQAAASVTAAERLEEKQRQAAEQAEAEYKQGEIYLQELRELEQMTRAAALAEGLADGQPCPVCGSLHHPLLARAARTVTAAAIKEQEKVRQQLEDRREAARRSWNEAKEKLAGARSSLQELSAEAERRPLQELKSELAKAQAAWQHAEAMQVSAGKLALQLEELKQQEKNLNASQEKLGGELSQAQSAAAAAGAEAEVKRRLLPVGLGEPGLLAGEISRQEQQLKRRTAAHDAARERCQTLSLQYTQAQADWKNAHTLLRKYQSGLQEQRENFQARLEQAGFKNRAEYLAARQGEWAKPAYLEQQEALLAEHGKELHAAKERLARAQQATEGQVCPDMGRLEEAAGKAERAYQEALAAGAENKARLKQFEDSWREYSRLQEQYKELDRQAILASGLADCALGKVGGHVSFQTYVLRYLLEEVMQAANLRLGPMTQGRYELVFGDRKGNAQGGLDIAALDAYAGKARPMATLSGGESFQASLALALGLADVIQAQAGGIHLDTMFIDEGFGTLDADTLDEVMKVLLDLSGTGRLVGIISHVEELKSLIPARLEVRKEPGGGSTAKFVFGTEQA